MDYKCEVCINKENCDSDYMGLDCDFKVDCKICAIKNDCSLPTPYYDCFNFRFNDSYSELIPNDCNNDSDAELVPKHYNANGFTPIQAFDAGLISKSELKGFIKGNIIKYVVRFDNKNGIDDLKKAKHYLNMLIKLENGEKL